MITLLTRDNRPDRPWTTDELKLLGSATDAVIAAKLRRTIKAVAARRCVMRIVMFAERN